MLTIYNDLKADDLEFISVSLDDSEAKWRKMLDEEKLPWVMLWDKTGFPKNSKTPSAIQAAYGFYSIPFLVVIDKEDVYKRQTNTNRIIDPDAYYMQRNGYNSLSLIHISAFEPSVVCLIPMSAITTLVAQNNDLAMFFIRQLSIDLGISDAVSYTHLDVYKRQIIYKIAV